MRRLIPDSIAARTLIVLFVGLTVSHLLSVALYITDRTSALMFTGGEHTGERIATILRLFENASPSERRRIVELADGSRLHVTLTEKSAIKERQSSDWQTGVLRDSLVAHLDGGAEQDLRLYHSNDDHAAAWREHLQLEHPGDALGETLMVSFRIRDGTWLNFAAPVEAPEPFWSLRFGLSMVVMVLAIVILSALIVHHLTRPLATFARAAQRLGRDVNAPPMSEVGPDEVRQAIRAFNEMQGRIRRFVEDRTQMLAAISHDLGTPITRLRLRAEFVGDKEQQSKMLADLDDMEKMVTSALSFARGEAASEPPVMIDLGSLVQRICDDMVDEGREVTLDVGRESVPYSCRPTALRRAISNVIDNAIKYGRQARVFLQSDEDGIVIRIDDCGPGIPEELREEAFKPFRRLEQSRNRETGGTGLGLTVARTIVRAHGGDVFLSNLGEGGLRVELRLPT